MTEGIDETGLDRILLDMPEPHKVVAAAAAALRPGGILLAYLPTINQTALLRQALDEDDAPFGLAETQEIMRRTWHVEARSVRPDHRMVGHTGLPHDGAAAGRSHACDEARPRLHRGDRPGRSARSSTACTRIVLAEHPDAEVALSYGMPAYRVGQRRLNLGVWKHGVSVYGWRADRDGGFVAAPPGARRAGRGRSGSRTQRCGGDLRRRAAGAARRGARALEAAARLSPAR